MNILVVSSEAYPFVKTGGLADSVGALSQTFARLGHDVRVVLPRYYSIDKRNLEVAATSIPVPSAHGERWAAAHHIKTSADYYFVDHEELFGRDGVYGPSGETAFPDNLLRFSFFSRSVLSLCRGIAWRPDVIHLHDWPAALLSLLLHGTDDFPDFASVPTVLTVHNAAYRGLFDAADVLQTGVSPAAAWRLGLIDDSRSTVNLLRGGLLYSDAVTTVSPGYARELTVPPFGAGLESLYRWKGVQGILNGVDYDTWNPATDPHLPAHYDADNLAGKATVTNALRKRLGLAVESDRPLVAMITRLTEQKGFRALTAGDPPALRQLADLPLDLVVLGTGSAAYESFLSELAAHAPNVRVLLTFDEALSHVIEAAADFLLMPSEWEPCGLNQVYSLRYGTIPIVTETGGLGDTVEDLRTDYAAGTGLVIPSRLDQPPEAGARIVKTVRRALELWKTGSDTVAAVRKRGMARRFSWEGAAADYLSVFEDVMRRKRRS